jgi:hypothetical protein
MTTEPRRVREQPSLRLQGIGFINIERREAAKRRSAN